MYNLKVDPHTHTIHTGHAYSTIAENVMVAAEKGLEAIAITDHFGLQLPLMMDGREYNLENHLKSSQLPDFMKGVRVFKGVEIDIIGFDGTLAGEEVPLYKGGKHNSFADFVMGEKEMVIASLHYFDGFRDKGLPENTQMYIDVLAREGVDILGHPVRCGLKFDWAAVVSAAKAYGKIIEINNAAMLSRPHQVETNRQLAQLCAEAGVPVCVSSDAHICFDVGRFEPAVNMLAEIGFPEELIASRSLAAFETALKRARGRL